MQLPFTTQQFFDLFVIYNTEVWPTQVLLLALGIAAVVIVFVPRLCSGVCVSAILGVLWLWTGLAYHLAFFAGINPLAYAFAALSVAGACIFIWQGVVQKQLQFRWVASGRAAAGLGLVVFALVIYPAWSTASGHGYPAMPTFGLPCPTTLFTVGMLALAVPPYPRAPLIVPVIWSFIGAQAAFLLEVQADLGLVVAGGLGIWLLLRAKRVPAESLSEGN